MPDNFAYSLRNSVIKSRALPIPSSYMLAYKYKKRRDFFRFLGWNDKQKAITISEKILPYNKEARVKREKIFEYIIKFWNDTILYVPFGKSNGKGLNLAKNPFLIPSAGNGTPLFQEQYRWDTRFQNLGLIIIGGTRLAIGQLENLSYVYKKYGKIPNALSTDFLTHGQPMLETTALFDLLHAGVKKGKWSNDVVETAEKELFTEWLDLWEKKIRHRMTPLTFSKYGFLTRHVNTHYSAMLVGAEDGKDHNWVSARFAEHYLPVQLNSIVYKEISDIITYYLAYSPNISKVNKYKELQQKVYNDFQKIFWVDKPGWKGFYNYAINPEDKDGHYEGPILFDELAQDIFPLWAKIATKEQAQILVENIRTKYETPTGLLTASKDVREGATMQKTGMEGWSFQWDYPNIWPPLMQIAVEGLFSYGYDELAVTYMKSWIRYIEEVFFEKGAFFEKYSFDKNIPISGGFYGLEEGFGWTIGTYIWMIHELDKRGEMDI